MNGQVVEILVGIRAPKAHIPEHYGACVGTPSEAEWTFEEQVQLKAGS